MNSFQEGGIQKCQYNFFVGVVVKLIPPEVDSVNNTLPGTIPFTEEVFPKDSKQQHDPTTVGFTFTKSDDPSVNRYGKQLQVPTACH